MISALWMEFTCCLCLLLLYSVLLFITAILCCCYLLRKLQVTWGMLHRALKDRGTEDSRSIPVKCMGNQQRWHFSDQNGV